MIEHPGINKVRDICEDIYPLLHGQEHVVVAAVLGDLLARFIAGHHPDIRDKVMNAMIKYIKQLIPVNEQEMFGDAGFPVMGIN